MPRLSVLLPVLNGGDTIGRAARSTLRAMPRDADLLVVDDGSTDRTAAVLAAIRDPRLRVLRHERPHGVARSLNEALAATDSDLVARMDGDDVCLPWRFRVQLPALGAADLVFGSMVLVDQRGRPTGLADPRPVSVTQGPMHLLIENPFAHPTLVARRNAIEDLGGYRETPVEDYELWLRAAASGQRLRKLAVPVLLYRRHAGQATQSWSHGAVDPVLDASYAALLPTEARPYASALRAAAVSRSQRSGVDGWPVLEEHLRERAALLGLPARHRLLARLARVA